MKNLKALCKLPFITPAGEIVAVPGFHDETGIYAHFDNEVMPPLPVAPNRAEIIGAIQTAGEYVSTGGGFAAGRVMNPAFDSASTALDQLYLILASLIFLTLNGHHLVLLGLAGTFRALPVAGPLPTFSLERLLMLSQSLLTAGLTLALPVLAASLMADLTLGLLARVAPQIQVFFLEGPLKVAIVMVTLIASLGVIVPGLTVLVRDIGPRMQWLVGM